MKKEAAGQSGNASGVSSTVAIEISHSSATMLPALRAMRPASESERLPKDASSETTT